MNNTRGSVGENADLVQEGGNPEQPESGPETNAHGVDPPFALVRDVTHAHEEPTLGRGSCRLVRSASWSMVRGYMLNTFPQAEPVWIDLCDPSPEERAAAEAAIGASLPSRSQALSD